MTRIRNLPQIEGWLDEAAVSWRPLSATDYTDLVTRWSATFGPAVEAGNPRSKGHRAVVALESRLPCDVALFSGVRVPRLANKGGQGAAGYIATKLRSLDRRLANQLELVVTSVDLSWCCVFTHEAGDFSWEELFDLA